MQIAAAYVRVSTDDQLEYSPDSQIKCIKEYARAHDMIIPPEYIFEEAEGVSGRSAKKRPEFQRMIGAARDEGSQIKAILVWKFSRFARNQEESIVYKSLLRKERNIKVISVSEPISDNNEFGSLIERIIEWMDGYYSTRLAGEVKRGMTERFNRGQPVSVAPYGYKMQDKQLVEDVDTAPTVRMLFEAFAAGAGYRDLACRLNAMGLRTRRGKLWENRTVEYILRNPVYIGKIRWNPEHITRRNYDDPALRVVDGTHQPLIPAPLWDSVQERVQQLKQMYAPKARRAGITRMLQGLARCSTCGSTLTPTGSGYQCIGYAHSQCTVSHYISAALLDRMVLAAITDDMQSGTVRIAAPRAEGPEDGRALVEGQLQREQQKIARVREAYEAGVDTLAEYRESKAKIQARMQQLVDSLREPPAPPVAPPDYRAACLEKVKKVKEDNVSTANKNAILRSFVDHADFDRVACTVEIFYKI